MEHLALEALVGLPRDLVDERAVRRDVDDAVGDHALDELVADERPTALAALGRPLDRGAQRALGRPGRARRDHQALLHEPVARELVALADLAEHRVGAEGDVLEGELGMLVDEGVHVARGAQDPHARRVLVDEKERRRALGHDVREHDHVVGDVADRDEPLLAVQRVAAVAGAVGRRGDRGRVRARVALRDGHAVAPLAADARQQVALALGLVARAQRVRRAPDHVPQRVRELPELLLDDDLVDHAQALAAPLGRHVDRVEAVAQDAVGDRAVDLGRQAVLLLAGDLVDLDVVGEGLRAVAEVELLGGVGEVHWGVRPRSYRALAVA